MAKEANIRSSVPHTKVQAWTRKKLHRQHVAAEKVRKQAAKAAARGSQRAARAEGKSVSVFEGIDPESTLRLIGEEN